MQSVGFKEASWTPYSFGIAGLYRAVKPNLRVNQVRSAHYRPMPGGGQLDKLRECVRLSPGSKTSSTMPSPTAAITSPWTRTPHTWAAPVPWSWC